MQDPNTSNLAVSIRVPYRVPAYGRLCMMLVHTADSLLIDTPLFYYYIERVTTINKGCLNLFKKSRIY